MTGIIFVDGNMRAQSGDLSIVFPGYTGTGLTFAWPAERMPTGMGLMPVA
jgi:hypothetical protein